MLKKKKNLGNVYLNLPAKAVVQGVTVNCALNDENSSDLG